MTKTFQDGYQAALADITAVMENVDSDCSFPEYQRRKVAEVQAWINNNTIIPTRFPTVEYRGYFIVNNLEEMCFEIYATKEDADNLEDMIDSANRIRAARTIIDKWVNAR